MEGGLTRWKAETRWKLGQQTKVLLQISNLKPVILASNLVANESLGVDLCRLDTRNHLLPFPLSASFFVRIMIGRLARTKA
jgi:hypothetical protein